MTSEFVDIKTVREKAVLLKEKINLTSSPVGVKFIFKDTPGAADKAEQLSGHRYCQALMKARRGKHVTIDAEGMSWGLVPVLTYSTYFPLNIRVT